MKSAPRRVTKLMPLVVCATLSGTAYAQNDAMSNVLQKLMSRKRDSEPIDLRASDDCDGVSFCG